MPGRIIGVSVDVHGHRAYRMSLQTREQHIRRDKATSNICTSQVLLAVMAGMYAVYHGPDGLKHIASRTHALARALEKALLSLGCAQKNAAYFDTLRISLPDSGVDTGALARLKTGSVAAGRNFRYLQDGGIGISVDETTTPEDVSAIAAVFATALGKAKPDGKAAAEWSKGLSLDWPAPLVRKDAVLTHPVFNSHSSETEMLRYIKSLENKDLSLNTSMIALGSCTMKLNATAEMVPLTWPEFGSMHPFAPADQTRGYLKLFADLERDLADVTGLPGVSLQPNAGSQGEYAGLMVIRAYHKSRGAGSAQRMPHPRHPPTAPTLPAPSWAASRWWWSSATTWATSTSPTCARKPRPHAGRPRPASWSPTLRPTACSKKASRKSATSSTRTAARCTWTAPT